jgi:hypothetical protein
MWCRIMMRVVVVGMPSYWNKRIRVTHILIILFQMMKMSHQNTLMFAAQQGIDFVMTWGIGNGGGASWTNFSKESQKSILKGI